ncbi:hypothetical protein [Haloglomus salinum]|jgi:hypothetical protein|uniref:hypothetical protein n=1 Tax=Haloglomus salinum TaxID=2962673 RepID=UPI0020CA0EC8|nr:hypothetical protein [Haloglomus salinum]
MRKLGVAAVAALAGVAVGIAGEASLAGLLVAPAPLLTVVRQLPLPVAAPAAVSLGMSMFTMVALKRETDLPLVISGMIVPVVVFLGFGLAVVLDRFTALTLVEGAFGLGVTLFGLVFVKQMVDPDP